MPQRAVTGATPAPRRAGANAPKNNTPANNSPATNGNQSDDVWDDIMNRKATGGGDDDGAFNKFNTNFYLRDGEKEEIVLLDNEPTIFWGHMIKGKWPSGSQFYRIEQCQKSQQGHCVLCDSENPAVAKAKSQIAFRVLDSRGLWDKKTGAMDYVPFPKIFFTPLYLAKQIKTLIDDADGELTDKVLVLQKNGNYTVNFKFEKNPNGAGMLYCDAPEIEDELPEILEVYAPQSDGDLIDFVRQYADSGAPAPRGGGNNATANNNSGRNGNQGSGFGRR